MSLKDQNYYGTCDTRMVTCYCTGECRRTGVCPATRTCIIKPSKATDDDLIDKQPTTGDDPTNPWDIPMPPQPWEPYPPQPIPNPWDASPRNPNMGWQCPRCGTVHAPHIDSCRCNYGTSTTTGVNF